MNTNPLNILGAVTAAVLLCIGCSTKPEPIGRSTYASIFDGETFACWEGNLDSFRIEDGAIVGGSLDESVPRNEFLATIAVYEDFELTVTFKLLGEDANAGIQFRTKRISDHHEVSGYQADMGQQFWGSLYDESRRRIVIAQADMDIVKTLIRHADWNEYRIRCEGPRIQLWLNGTRTVDYIEQDETIPRSGIIALQIHGGPPSEAWYKDIRIQQL